jgi:tetratricopeptide (TPR) repeat protein
MRVGARACAVAGGIGTLILAQNLFGREVDAFFLRYPGVDKPLHFLEYFLVVVLVHAALPPTTGHVDPRIRIALGVGIVLALLDEIVQQFAAARTVDILDVVANFAGISMAWVVLRRPPLVPAVATTLLAVGAGSYVTWHTHLLLRDYSRALQYERQQDFVRAREHYIRAYVAGLRTPSLLNQLGWVEIESGVGDPQKAVQYARMAHELEPENADILDTYGWALHHAGNQAEALRLLEAAYRKNPEMFCINYHLGAVYLSLSRIAEAERHFRRQLDLTGTREASMAASALAQMKR